MTGAEAAERARALFVDDSPRFGCAETALAILMEAKPRPGTNRPQRWEPPH